ncbi:hypothetical protein BD626DRAFT_574759 [Schizophyllum amplum]|uniref:Uncharacterized protein n=1 Tax=Schizophyllum amplum TaxID=97359 RepID=A0A550BXB3_9AGAR|nr:hypothetical protein BD626DRAFT_574759 [Auriculariopsis ampla]
MATEVCVYAPRPCAAVAVAVTAAPAPAPYPRPRPRSPFPRGKPSRGLIRYPSPPTDVTTCVDQRCATHTLSAAVATAAAGPVRVAQPPAPIPRPARRALYWARPLDISPQHTPTSLEQRRACAFPHPRRSARTHAAPRRPPARFQHDELLGELVCW